MSSMVPGIVRSEILKPLTCKIGRTAPDSAGSIHLCELMRYIPVSETALPVRGGVCPPRNSLPGTRSRAGLALAVADNDDRDLLRAVHDGAVSSSKRVAELATLVDAARGFRLQRQKAGQSGEVAGRWGIQSIRTLTWDGKPFGQLKALTNFSSPTLSRLYSG